MHHEHRNDQVRFPPLDVEQVVRRTLAIILDHRIAAEDIPGDALLFVSDPGSDAAAVRLDLDSLDGLELMLSLEAAFGGSVPGEIDTSAIRTVDDLCRFVGMLLLLPSESAAGPERVTGGAFPDE